MNNIVWIALGVVQIALWVLPIIIIAILSFDWIVRRRTRTRKRFWFFDRMVQRRMRTLEEQEARFREQNPFGP
jgi:hypothetical protein